MSTKPRKSTPVKSKSKSPPKTSQALKYEYVELSKVALSQQTQPVNFYGVITDATFPYKKNELYICSLKVIDPTLNSKNKQDHALVVIYATRFEDLPIVHRIGDIIRIHRANVRVYNGKRQFNVNMYYKSSWVLYSSDKLTPLGQQVSDQPYAYSGKKPTQEKQDVAITQTLKKWVNQFFSTTNVIEDKQTTELKKASKSTSDFDIVAKVLQVFQLDEYTNELKLKDQSGEVFYTLALRIKFPHIRQGMVVRIRSCTFDGTSTKKVLVLQHYSNIMSFISSSKLASTVSTKVSDDKNVEKAALKSEVSMTPVILTEVEKKHQSLPITPLHDLFHAPEQSSTTFRTCFYVTKVEPGQVADCVKAYNKGTKKVSSAKGAAKGSDLIYQVQFLVKDVSTQFNNNVYRILLYTHDGLGASFFPVKAANLWEDKKAAAKVKESVDLLTRFNSWVDCVVERRNGYYFIKDTKMVF